MAVDSMGVVTLKNNEVSNLRTDFKTENGTAIVVDDNVFYTLKNEFVPNIVIAIRTTAEGVPAVGDKAKMTIYGEDSATLKFESGKDYYAWAANKQTELVIAEAAV